MIKQNELTDFSKSQLALYFYNNSNYVAILFPQRAFKRRKAFIYGLFTGAKLLPLHGSGGFGGYIVNNSVYMFYFIYDTA